MSNTQTKSQPSPIPFWIALGFALSALVMQLNYVLLKRVGAGITEVDWGVASNHPLTVVELVTRAAGGFLPIVAVILVLSIFAKTRTATVRRGLVVIWSIFIIALNAMGL